MIDATPIEAKKDGLAQLQDGCWKLTLKVHLNDMPTWLMKASMGTRLACAIVEIGDDENPVRHKEERSPAKKAYQAKTEGEKAVTRAVMLCDDPLFQNWIRNIGVEVSPRNFLLCECEIFGRGELAVNARALARFLKIERDYREATGQAAECR